MKIHFISNDSRRFDDDFLETCGSFDVIQETLKKSLKILGVYTDDLNEATHVGMASCLETNFNYPGKKVFQINFQDTINTIPFLALANKRDNPSLKLFAVNQHTADLWNKYGFECRTIGPFIDENYWKPVDCCPYNFTFVHNAFCNFRSGVDQLIQAFTIAFRDNEDVRLIIKDTSNSEKLIKKIKTLSGAYKVPIEYIGERWTFSRLREFYSNAHVACNVLRFSAHGLPIAESSSCGAICLTGDFNPSNTIMTPEYGVLLKPEKEVLVKDVMPELVNEWGLVDTFGGLQFPEEPKIYSYNIYEYADLLRSMYLNYNDLKRSTKDRINISKLWDNEKAAKNLVKYLKDDE